MSGLRFDLIERDSGVVVVNADVEMIVALYKERGDNTYKLIGRGTLVELARGVATLFKGETLKKFVGGWKG